MVMVFVHVLFGVIGGPVSVFLL